MRASSAGAQSLKEAVAPLQLLVFLPLPFFSAPLLLPALSARPLPPPANARELPGHVL
jgi:hypothetical protein